MPDITKLNIRIFSYSVIALMLLAIITGLVVVGSPATEQARRLDAERINHLQMIQSYIVSFWRNTNRLPASLDELSDPLQGIQIPRDPKTGEPYEYRILGPRTLELCAMFDGARQGNNIYPEQPKAELEGDWDHDAGRACFTRTINPERIRPTTFEKPLPS